MSYIDVADNVRLSSSVVGRVVRLERLLGRIGSLGRVLLSRNVNSRVINIMSDVSLIQLTRDVNRLDAFGETTAIAGRYELFNRIGDIIRLLRRIVLANDRNNGLGISVDDISLNQISYFDSSYSLRRALTDVERITLFNRLLNKIRLIGRNLLAYDRNNNVINLLIHLRLTQQFTEVDNLGNFKEFTKNEELIEFLIV